MLGAHARLAAPVHHPDMVWVVRTHLDAVRVNEQVIVLLPRLNQVPITVVEQKAVLAGVRVRVVDGVAGGAEPHHTRAFEHRQLACLDDEDEVRRGCPDTARTP